MKQFAITIRWIDPNGNGVISTFLYKGKTEEEAYHKGFQGFKKYVKKLFGYYEPEQMEMRDVSVEETKSGHFSDRKWNNPK